MCVQDMKV